jgi:DNA excision repair protein ERCC-2
MGAKDEDFRGLGLTSRRNLCLHPEVRFHLWTIEVAKRREVLMSRSVKRRKEKSSILDVVI